MAETSTAEAPPVRAGYAGGAAAAGQGRGAPVQAWLRLFRSELRLVFGRRRNQALLAVVDLFPIIIGIGLRLAEQLGRRQGGAGGAELTGSAAPFLAGRCSRGR